MIVNCANCGKTVKVSPCRKKPHNFCSRVCFAQYFSAKPQTCPMCGKEFCVEKSRSQKYCSRACFVKDRFGHDTLSPEEKKIEDCYIKEAKAMIEGKHWEGKNLCVKLPGDEGYVPPPAQLPPTIDLPRPKSSPIITGKRLLARKKLLTKRKVLRQKEVLKFVVDSWQSIKANHPDGDYAWSEELIAALNKAEELLEPRMESSSVEGGRTFI
jgi:hypothetical protein